MNYEFVTLHLIFLFSYSFKVSNAQCDKELQDVLTSDDGLDTLDVIGYTGVLHKEKIISKNTILQYVSLF